MPGIWICLSCCGRHGRSYQLPPEGDVRCNNCRAPLSLDDIESSLAGNRGGVPILQFESTYGYSDPLSEVRAELRHMSATLADLKLAMLGPSVSAISIEQAASLLGCGRTQIFGFLKSGKLRRAKRLGRKVMVRMTSVSALMQSLSEDRASQRSSIRRSARATITSRAIRDLPLSGTR